MIELVSIRLRNFRAVKEGVFAPLLDGITGLSGENGAGKSSFLAGALWAMYGVRPDDVPTGGLRRQAASVDEECSVSVIIRHAGQTIEIIRELRGKSNRALINILVDGKEQTVTSVGVAERWIINRLKIDANAFMTAFVIRQKELDSLVKARPAERRANIERLSGIEAMSLALKAARAEESDAKRNLAALPGNPEDVTYAASILMEQEQKQVSLGEQLFELKEELSVHKKIYSNVEHQHSQIVRQERKYQNAQKVIENFESQLSQQEKNLKQAHSMLESHLKDYPEIDVNESSEIEEKFNLVKEKVDGLRRDIQNHQIDMSQKRSMLSNKKERLGNIDKEKTTLSERIEERNISIKSTPTKTIVTKKEKEVKTLSDALGDLKSLISRTEETAENLRESIAALKNVEHEDHAECPTCHSSLENPDQLIESLTKSLESLPDVSALRKDLSSQQAFLINVQKELDDLRIQASKKEQYQDEIKTFKQSITDKKSEEKELSQSITDLEKLISEGNDDTSLEDTLRDAQKALENVQEERNTVRNNIKAQDTLERLRSNAKNIETNIKNIHDEMNIAHSSISMMDPVNSYDVELSQKLLKEAQDDVTFYTDKVSQKDREYIIATERVSTYEKEVKAQEAMNARRSAAFELVRAKTAVSDVLDEFRKNRIATIAPELSETATHLISSMTSGYYTEVLLDENFTPSVVDIEGNIRPVSWLSGGEESVVALSLRIAIGDLMSGGEGGLLWLDEVLTAQDGRRRASLLDSLRNISGKQIIMINHTQDALDIVDKTVTVVREDNDGSVIYEEPEEELTENK